MARNRIVIDVATGSQTVVPYTAQEEADAGAIKAADDLARAPIIADQVRVAAVKANARRIALVTAIQGSDDAGVISYVNTKVTDLASAKVLLTDLALLVAGVIRS